jgi:hypothetical protein
MIRLVARPLLPLSRQQLVSLSQSSCVSLTDERGGRRGWAWSQIILPRESLALFKSSIRPRVKCRSLGHEFLYLVVLADFLLYKEFGNTMWFSYFRGSRGLLVSYEDKNCAKYHMVFANSSITTELLHLGYWRGKHTVHKSARFGSNSKIIYNCGLRIVNVVILPKIRPYNSIGLG